ncbi:class I SAM-dependent methyltransferase [Jatrophihabitans lederbergiae]|uniref:Class I SAM-dependent methyltransferase n=1 Tax=Jatrophihabitans lederbergiae TaxID=3075547 RepID=A0ABU2JAS0_9ACTN|nr:class I SAM-dependent methyltransferase [Jatrophihabitans sp. DSM 44399]MDT0262079.1 class I SAM-dependent methyltransferase [Jatrophihabitans sp. DSM 44399]
MNHFVYPDATREEMLPFLPVPLRQVLDVGCSSGAFGELVKRVHPDAVVHGVEPSADTAAIARTRIDAVFQGLFPEGLPPAKFVGTYDCIVFNDVIEHVLESGPLLKAAETMLSQGGTLVASVPNVRFAPVVLGLIMGRWDYQDQGVLDRTHLRFFTRRSLSRLFRDTGWDVVRLERLNTPGSRRAPLLAAMLRLLARDFSCPQFAVVATPSQGTNKAP